MPFSRLDTGAVARSLAQIADRPSDIAEVYFERLEEVELPESGAGVGFRSRREQGFAVRLLRDGLSWIAARDEISSEELANALRQVARALPAAPYPRPRVQVEPQAEPPDAPEVRAFPARVRRRIRERRAAFPFELRVCRHRRLVQVVGTRLVPGPQTESFYSCVAELPWGRYGAVLPGLEGPTADRLAGELLESFAAREAPPPEEGRRAVVLAPAAVAVLLHEAVSHALESDTLILGGSPEAALGLELGSPLLNVLDDPETAPEGARRDSDDEGMQVVRRWLLKEGKVQQPIADRFAAASSSGLTPGAARRSGRYFPPVPRSTHLELLPGDTSMDELLAAAGDGLLFERAQRGRLDPLTGEFELQLPHGRHLRQGEAVERCGPCRLRGRVAELLQAVTAVGDRTEVAGAGWCAKGGQRLAVWATAPALAIGEARICR